METIIEAFPFISIGALVVSVAALVIAVLALRSMRRSVQLAEKRMMDYLHEEQVRLAFLREEHQRLTGELKRVRQEHPEARQEEAEHAEQKRLAKIERYHDLPTEEPQREQREQEQEQQEREQHSEAQRQAEKRGKNMGDRVGNLVNGYIEGMARQPEEMVTLSIKLSEYDHAKLLWLAKNLNTQEIPLAEKLLNAAMDEAIEQYARWASPHDPAKFLEKLPAYIEDVERNPSPSL